MFLPLRRRLALTLVLCVSGSMPARAQTTTTVRTGSGFAISHATHIVTNAHVVAQCKSLRVLSGAQQASGRVLAIDVDADLAVLQTSLSVPKTMAMRSSPALRLGESVIAFGFPLTGALSQGGNLTTGNVSALAGLRDDPKYIQVTAPVQPGNSGGPLLDGGGNVIGVITAKLDALAVAKRTGDVPQNVNFAVRAEVLEAFLQTHKIPYDVAVTDQPARGGGRGRGGEAGIGQDRMHTVGRSDVAAWNGAGLAAIGDSLSPARSDRSSSRAFGRSSGADVAAGRVDRSAHPLSRDRPSDTRAGGHEPLAL